jgi:hypothetical protein
MSGTEYLFKVIIQFFWKVINIMTNVIEISEYPFSVGDKNKNDLVSSDEREISRPNLFLVHLFLSPLCHPG